MQPLDRIDVEANLCNVSKDVTLSHGWHVVSSSQHGNTAVITIIFLAKARTQPSMWCSAGAALLNYHKPLLSYFAITGSLLLVLVVEDK